MKKQHIIKTMVLGAVIMGLLETDLFAGQLDSGAKKVSWWKRTFGTLSWEDVQNTAQSPETIADSVYSHVQYRADSLDEWDDGLTTWQRGYGDCEDIAACIVDLCRKKNIEAWVQVFLPVGSLQGHAVAMGRLDGKIWIAGRTFAIVENIEEAKTIIGREMRWGKGSIHTLTLASVAQTSIVTASETK